MPSLKFPYRKYPFKSSIFPKQKSVLRPTIPLRLIRKDKHIDYYALIDSGADFCLFHSSVGELIGLNIKAGKVMVLHGLEKGKAKAYFHSITIEVGGWKYPCYAGFSYDIEGMPHGLLGQKGFFDIFVVNLDLEKERIELKQREQ